MKKSILQSWRKTRMVALASILSVLFAIPSSAQDVWDGTVAGAFAAGEGSEESPFVIETPQQLAYLANRVNNVSNYMNGSFYVVLNADIILNENVVNDDKSGANEGEFKAWTPIGKNNSSYYFKGHFDGRGHTIKGLYINSRSSSYQGLFGYCSEGEIQNVNIEDSYAGVYDYSALLAGYMNASTVTNCKTSGVVVGRQRVGGVVGASTNASHVSYCESRTTVSCNSYDVAGIVGWNNSNSDISRCTNYGDISTNGTCVGGVAGYCAGNVEYSNNYGNISNKSSNYTGGVVGRIESADAIKYCNNSGKIYSEGDYTGGVCGKIASGHKAYNCRNTGEVTGHTHTGGIIGYCENNSSVFNSWNAGNVTSANNGSAGGITGYCSTATLVNNLNSGDVTSNERATAGISGYTNYGTYKNNLNIGKIHGATARGSIIGYLDNAPTLVNNYTIQFASESDRLVHESMDWGGAARINGKGVVISNPMTINDAQYTNVLLALNAWSAANSSEDIEYLPWTASGDLNNGLPYLASFRTTAPVISVAAGKATITAEGDIYYTTDGSVPTSESNLYIGEVALSGTCILRAIAIDNGMASEVASYNNGMTAVATPVVSISNGKLSISCETSGATVYYTINGLKPTTNDAQFKNAVNIIGSCTVKAYAVKSGSFESAVATYEYKNTAVWDGTAATDFDSGSGTIDDPYIISTAEQLALLANKVNDKEGENWSVGKCFKLANDIYLNDIQGDAEGEMLTNGTLNQWTPIGIYSDSHYFQFQGTFDGDGHTIYGLYHLNTAATGTDVGLFGATYNSEIRNTIVKNSYIYGYKYCASIVGRASNTVITNCANYGRVRTQQGYDAGIVGWGSALTISDCANYGYICCAVIDCGGVIGYTNGSVTNCTNYGEVYGTSVVHGGVVGALNGSVANCRNYGYVNGSGFMGGVAAWMSGSVTDCHNHGKIYSTSERTGGVIGYMDNGSPITACTNNAPVDCIGAYVGGIIGFANSSSAIKDCVNNAKITITNSSYCGGIVGYCENNNSYIANCMNNDSIIGVQNNYNDYAPDRLGGIAGHYYGRITECTNNGVVTGNIIYYGNSYALTFNYYGGIVGYKNNNDVTYCVNNESAKVSGNNRIGGIIGDGNAATVAYNVNYAEVEGTGEYVGGIMGYLSYAYNINDNRNTANVNGGTCVGGIAGEYYYAQNGRAFYNNYNVGDVTGTGANIGGVIGRCKTYNRVQNVYDCYNTGLVKGSSQVGGIVGILQQGNVNISYSNKLYNCYNLGSVVATNTNAGGIVGQAIDYSYVYNCYSAADSVVSPSNAGKLIGLFASNATACHNYAQAIEGLDDIFGAESSPKEQTYNRTFNADLTFGNPATIGEESVDNLHDALATWATQNSATAWLLDASRNAGYPYLSSFICAKPTITQNSDKEYVIASATAGVKIYYTLDRTAPTVESSLYDTPFITDDNNYIKAYAVKEGYYDSEVAEFDCYTSEFTPGDVNNDKRILTSDIVTTVNYILGKNPTPFIFRAADINGDNEIAIEDVTGIVDIILGRSSASAKARVSEAQASDDANVDFAYSDGFASVGISTATSIKAFQFDIILPDGTTAASPALTSRATASHTMGWNTLDNGAIRFLAYSMNNALFEDTNGDVLSFILYTDGMEAGEYPVVIDNIRIVKQNGAAIHPTAINATLVIDNATGIAKIVNGAQTGSCYNLAGQKVNAAYKGIVIKNGVKVIR